MSRYPLLLLLVLPWSAQAVICKSVDAKGGVAYSEVPGAECKHPVSLPEVSRYAPPPVGAGSTSSAGNGATDVAAPFTGYTEMRIEQPVADGAVRSNEGRVPVAVSLVPSLQQGHYLQLVLDGTLVAPPAATLGSTLTGISPGTHSLQARIVDAQGRVLYSTGAISFTLLRKARETNIPTTPPKAAYQPRYVPPSNGTRDFQPANPVQPFQPGVEQPDYSPQSQADYAPETAPIPQASGNTHPDFAPNYRP
jgi:hypothetical protein